MPSPSNEPLPRTVGLEQVFRGDGSVTEAKRFQLSSNVAYLILALFVATTACVIWLVVDLANVDQGMIIKKQIKPEERLVTEKVLMMVIGATFVQVGAGAYLIVQSLFKMAPTSQLGNSE